MASRVSHRGHVATSVTDLTVGDGLYCDASETLCWVVDITPTTVVLENVQGASCTWRRDTLDASFDAHTWIQQT